MMVIMGLHRDRKSKGLGYLGMEMKCCCPDLTCQAAWPYLRGNWISELIKHVVGREGSS